LERRGATLYRPYGLASLAETLVCRGEHDPALAALREGFDNIEATGERWWEAELHRVNGIVLVGLNKLGEGQTAFEEALRLARHQKAKSLELRAATSLARLWGQQGRRAEALDLLAPVYGWFTEGVDTADLKEAKALVDQLA
jgi:predicted ATPase